MVEELGEPGRVVARDAADLDALGVEVAHDVVLELLAFALLGRGGGGAGRARRAGVGEVRAEAVQGDGLARLELDERVRAGQRKALDKDLCRAGVGGSAGNSESEREGGEGDGPPK